MPLHCWRGSGTYSLFVIVINFTTKTLFVIDLVLQAESVVFKRISCLDALLGRFVLVGVFLSFLNHSIDFFLRETSLVVGDGYRLRLSSPLVARCDLQDSVGVKLK